MSDIVERLREHEANKRMAKQLAAKQAEIDRLMLEYCPDQMTEEQVEEWGKNQEAFTPKDLDAALDDALAKLGADKTGEV